MKVWPYRLLAPLDALCRRINAKQHLPPIHLRRYVGPLATFEQAGGEFLAYLKLLGGLRAGSHVLDIGCGCGLMALLLRDQLDTSGTYVGMDISREAIDWCQCHIAAHYDNFSFVRSDIHNLRYNPTGTHDAETYTFPGKAHDFDLILAKSVFTHIGPSIVQHYFSEIARLLAPGGRALLTFFLLNDAQRELAERDCNALDFCFGDEVWRYMDEQVPEIAVAYDEARVLQWLREVDLRLCGDVGYGTWSGRQQGLSFQDILVVEPL